MKLLHFLIGVLGLIVLSGCAAVPKMNPTVNPSPSPTMLEKLSLTETASQVIQALSAQDLQALASSVHPQRGLRFSPYAFVREEHQVFMAEELPGLFESDQVFTWGRYDGTGEPIELTFAEYYDEFVYSSDFASADQVAVNERLGQGNTVNNIEEFYPEVSFVEYYLPGTEEEYAGMDWESLRLVFVQEDGAWMLVGIVHDEWTI